MARPARSPVLGYNHNVRYHGRIYHVQTEDSGPGNPRIFTHLFFSGTIVATKRYDYDVATPEDDVKEMMQGQHRGILKELKRGLYDAKIQMHFTAMGEEPFLDQVSETMPTAEQIAEATAEDLQTSAASAESEAQGLDVDAEPAAPVPAYPAESDPDTLPHQTVIDLPVVEVPMIESSMTDSSGGAYAMGAGEPFVALDLDALPPVVDNTPEPEAFASPPPIAPARPTGSGVYVKIGGTADRPFARSRPTGTQPTLPQQPQRPFDRPQITRPQITRPPVTRPLVTRPPVTRPHVVSPSMGTRPPVVVVRPPMRQQPMTPPPRAPAGGVVVQRTVVVGVGGPGGVQRPRRPRPSVPYVVKEGSHPLVQNPRAAQVAPAIPTRYPSPTPAQAATISDKSLDEVILAYLSQDTDTKR